MGAIKHYHMQYQHIVDGVAAAIQLVNEIEDEQATLIADNLVDELGITELCQRTKPITYKVVYNRLKGHCGKAPHEAVCDILYLCKQYAR